MSCGSRASLQFLIYLWFSKSVGLIARPWLLIRRSKQSSSFTHIFVNFDKSLGMWCRQLLWLRQQFQTPGIMIRYRPIQSFSLISLPRRGGDPLHNYAFTCCFDVYWLHILFNSDVVNEWWLYDASNNYNWHQGCNSGLIYRNPPQGSRIVVRLSPSLYSQNPPLW